MIRLARPDVAVRVGSPIVEVDIATAITALVPIAADKGRENRSQASATAPRHLTLFDFLLTILIGGCGPQSP